MPASLTDAQLLREFATSRDERAFAELVTRHQDMVFSTALRRTGRSDLAADVAQHVFLALATKAAWLSTRATVGGWLYKSTLLETARRQRDEARRHARERRYAEEEMKLHPPHEGLSAEDDEARRAKALLPHLDDALATLPDPDREAIVLRFLRGLSLRDTGNALGTTEEAARKRVSRAVEKLSAAFQRRGVTASAAVLASAVLPRAVDAAPAGLGAALAGAGASAPATGTAGTLFMKAATLSKTQLVAACVLTAAVPVTWQAVQIQQLQEQNRALVAAQDTSEAGMGRPVAPPSPLTVGTSTTEDPGGVASEANRPPPPKHDRRGKWDEWRELQRQQQRESRLAALHERVGINDTQLSVIAEATARAEAEEFALHEVAREKGTTPNPADAAAIATRRDQAIAEALGDEQWAEYQAFVQEEEAGRREIFANRLLADLQTTLHLTDTQKDQLFAVFAAEAVAESPEAWRAPIEAMDNTQTDRLAEVLTEEQFKLWRQRAEMWSQLFRRGPEPR
jgi:RNA polymerase sigma factor (sigma-70 family)